MKTKLCVSGFLMFVLCASATATEQTDSLWIIVRNTPIEELKTNAEKGDATAQCALGLRYLGNGHGVKPDDVEAAKWFDKSAEQGNVDAQGLLGYCYEEGKGVPKDVVEGLKWDRKAAEQGSARSECSLGFIYYYGKGVTKDYAEAAKWFRMAAEQGDEIGESQLGECYRFGQGVPQDYVEAYKWYNLAAAQDAFAVNSRELISAKMTPSQIAEGQQLSRDFVPLNKIDSSITADSLKAGGTGFFITEDGYLITNEHVVESAAKVRLVTSAGIISAKVVKVDAANDLALLKAEGKFSPLPIASSRTMHLGNTVTTVGFPNIGLQGFAPKFARGEIAALSGAADDARYFQISVPVQPGNSGGALVDERGNVVGVVSAKLSALAALNSSGALPENVNYAVKSSFLLSFLESVPEVSAKLKEPETKERKAEDVVRSAEQAAVLVLVY